MALAYTEEQTKQLNDLTFDYLLVVEKDHVLTLTLNRPAKKNAMTPQFMNEIVFALNYAHYNNDIWVVVIQANGTVYTAGADLKAFAGVPEETTSTVPKPEKQLVVGDALNHLHKPCIAKVHANVYAGGHLLICGCTHVITADTAQFSLPEVKRGIWPMQVMASLAPIMNARQLLDYCMRAKALNADEALKLGLATDVVATEDLDDTVNNLVAEIKSLSPSAIRLGLKAWDEMKNVEAEKQHSFLLGMLKQVLGTEDAAEGLRSFAEKRAPKWTGK